MLFLVRQRTTVVPALQVVTAEKSLLKQLGTLVWCPRSTALTLTLASRPFLVSVPLRLTRNCIMVMLLWTRYLWTPPSLALPPTFPRVKTGLVLVMAPRVARVLHRVQPAVPLLIRNILLVGRVRMVLTTLLQLCSVMLSLVSAVALVLDRWFGVTNSA